MLLLLGCCVDVGVAGLNGSNTERLEVRGATLVCSEGGVCEGVCVRGVCEDMKGSVCVCVCVCVCEDMKGRGCVCEDMKGSVCECEDRRGVCV